VSLAVTKTARRSEKSLNLFFLSGHFQKTSKSQIALRSHDWRPGLRASGTAPEASRVSERRGVVRGGARSAMAEVADGRTFHPRLTNLGTCEFGFALALPRFSEAVVEDVEPPSEPKIAAPLLDRLTKILQNTNVAYL
jgi:hypothetical protein